MTTRTWCTVIRPSRVCLLLFVSVCSGFQAPMHRGGRPALAPRSACSSLRLGSPVVRLRHAAKIRTAGLHCLAASGAAETAPERLLTWAKERGAVVSDKIGVGAGGVVATGAIGAGEVLIGMEEGLSLSPKAIRGACPSLVSFEEANEELKDFDVLVIGLLLAARGMIPACEGWRGGEPLDLPVFWEQASIDLLGPETGSMVDYMRMDLEACVETCSKFVEAAEWAGGGAPEKEELHAAYALARSRATMQKAKDGEEAVFLYPIMEAFNHQPPPFKAGESEEAPKFLARVPASQGPAAEVSYADGKVEFTSVRDIAEGETVTLDYGALTNQALLLGHGRVPQPFVHGANRVRFSLPGALFTKSVEAMSEGSSQRLLEQKATVMSSMGVGDEDQLDFEVAMGEEPFLVRQEGVPVPMSVIVSYMCLNTDDEMAKLCVSVGGTYASISPANEVRAYRWMGWLLGQVEEQLFEEDVRTRDFGKLLEEPEGAAVEERRSMFAAQLLSGEHLTVRYAKEAALAKSEAVAKDNNLLTGADASKAANKKKFKKYKGGKRAPRGFG